MYEKQTWVDGTSIVDAEKLNHIEDGIYENSLDNVYSTDETFTGKYWIDGKPIYRKVVNAGEITTDNVSLTFTVLNNVENIVSAFAYIATTNHSRALPVINGNAALRISWDLDKQTNTLYLDTERDDTVPYEGAPIYCILEYTKTTD